MSNTTNTDKGWRFRGNELKYVKEVIDAGFGSGTTGSKNLRVEQSFCKRFGIKYAITSNSGTSTIHQALMAMGAGPGDEVIVPALSPMMCGFAPIYAGAAPVFADIDKNTFTIDPKDVEKKITRKTKVILAVNLYGQVCDMTKIMSLAKKYDLYVLEDCAQCYLGTDEKGRLGGTIGHVGSFSLQTSKHITCGDGGILVTNDEKLGERMRKFGGLGFKHQKADRSMIKKNRDLFQDPQYLRHDNLGWNYRMSELSAAVALAQIEKLDWLVNKRQQMAKKYLEAIDGCDWLVPQYQPKGYKNSYYTFVVRYDGMEKFGVSWYDFRKKYIEFGGDGIYAAWALIYNEPIINLINKKGRYCTDLKGQATYLKSCIKKPQCPTAEYLQPRLLQFTTNQGTITEMNQQRDILRKTIKYFNTSK
jgi:perosamine synthetase